MSKRTPLERAVDRELIAKGKDVVKDFDESQALYVPARKRESKLISIRLPMAMIRQLRAVAGRRGDIGYQQIIKLYLAESLETENRQKEIRDLMAPLPGGFEVLSVMPFGAQSESEHSLGDISVSQRSRWCRAPRASSTTAGPNTSFDNRSE